MKQKPEIVPPLKASELGLSLEDQLKNLKIVEQALRESEERFRIAQEVSIDGFSILKPRFDQNGNIVDMVFAYQNAASARMNGTTPEGVIGKGVLELFPGIENTKFFHTYKRVFVTKQAIEFEDHYRGETIVNDKWFRIVVVPTRNGIAVHAQDITERKKAEESIAFQADLLSKVNDAVMATDEKFNITYWNKSAEDLFGWKQEEVIGKSAAELLQTKFENTSSKKSREKLLKEGQFKGEAYCLRKDGTYILVESNSKLIRDSDGEIRGLVTTILNITDIKKSADALRISELNLNEAQHLAHMCSFIFDFEQNSFKWTEEFLNIFEIETQSSYPTIEKMMDLVHPDDRQYVKETVGHAIENKMESLQMEYRIITGKGNVKYVNYRGKFSYNEKGKHIKRFGTIIDITERKVQELELRRTLEKLERSNKDLEQFAYVSSHDLQEPLRMVSIYSTILQKNLQGTLNEKDNQYLEILIESSKRIHSLITGLLDYSRITSTKEEPIHVDMNNIVKNILKDLSSSIDETKAKVIVENLPSIKANPVQMKLLMLNLVSNAIKFTAKDVKPCIEIKGEKKKGSVVYSVKDNGIGINPEDFERIFVIFHRLHARDIYPGTGIGLSVCKRIVESHGGRIWIESESGRGATFYFALPA